VGTTDIIGSVFVGASALLFLSGHATVLLLCAIAAVIGVLNALWWPAFAGLLPEVVPSEHLQAANSLVGLGANIGFTLGATMGAGIVSTAGPGWAIIGDGATFLVAGILVLQLQLPTKMQTGAIDKHPTMISQLRQGWSEFYSRKWIVVIVICFAFINMCFEGFIGVLAPVQMKEQLGGAKDMGILLFAFGVGNISGVLISLKIRPKHPLRVAMIWMPFVGLLVLSLAIPLPLPLIALIAVAAGISFDLFFVLWMTTFQTQIPQEALSRVGSYDAFGSMLFAPIGLFVAGPLAQWIGARDALLIAGSVVLIASVSALLVRDVRNLESAVDQLELREIIP
jgi:predicted MFS family arabinose efflux permease